MDINDKLLDQLIAGYKKPEDLIGENGLLKQLTKNDPVGKNTGNSRNGIYRKKLKG